MVELMAELEGKALRYASHAARAYWALVEERYGVRPPHGVIRYAGDGVDVEVLYTQELEARLKATLERMREARVSEDVHRSHNSSPKCRGCGFREVCSESLA